ncbi:MAG: gliding motility protein GldN [Bacteroidetes bacterium]|nr:gliding motility protein GldN [Bacteroidota bacterium]
MKKYINVLFFGLLALFVVSNQLASAQQSIADIPQYNPHSVAPIPKYEQLYKVTVWRSIDLKEKQNKGYFAFNNELSKILIEGVMSGEISHIYENDSLTTEITKEEFLARRNMYEEEDDIGYDEWYDDEPYFMGDATSYNGVNYESLQDDNEGNTPDTSPEFWQILEEEAEIYEYSQISLIQIKEDIIFDKRRSRLYYDIQSIKLFVPGSASVEKFDKELGVFSYKEIEDYFRRRPDVCIWYNQYNSAENKNLADAFLMRLFMGNLTKVENPDNLIIKDIYSRFPKEGVFAAEWLEMELMEKEHNLWSY